MKKKTVIITILVGIFLSGGFAILFVGGPTEVVRRLTQIGGGSNEYRYQNEEIQTLSEEANINLEIGVREAEEGQVDPGEEDLIIVSQSNVRYNGFVRVNDNQKDDWILEAGIEMEEGVDEYVLWKELSDGTTEEKVVLEQIGFEQWGYQSNGEFEFEGTFLIAPRDETGSAPSQIIYRIEG